MHDSFFLITFNCIYQFGRTATGQFNHLSPMVGTWTTLVYWENIDEGGVYPYNIFQNLDNCNQLTKFSCPNCMAQWHSATEIVPLMHPLPSQFCSQWLIQSAPLLLQYFNCPIYEHDLPRVLTRFHVTNPMLDRPPFQLIPSPTDINNYYDVP